MLVAALKPLATCLCPRCLVEKNEVHKAGTPEDDEHRMNTSRVDSAVVHGKIRRARKLIFQGRSINSRRVKDLLNAQSLNPVQVGIFSSVMYPTI